MTSDAKKEDSAAARPRAATGDAELGPGSFGDKRRLLLLVRTGLTLAIGYLLLFSDGAVHIGLPVIAFVIAYIASNVVIALLPVHLLRRGGFDIGLILADTAAISFALSLIPEANTDVFVFYFTIILLASISDRVLVSLLAPVLTCGAYLAFLLARHGVDEILQPHMLLRLPFFLLTGTFYGFFVDRVRRSQIAVAAARQRAAARTELLAMITHDLKQPLWVATESATMLYERLQREGGAGRELAAQVMVSLRRMESLTLNFLDLGKLESRGLRAQSARVALTRVVEDLLAAYRPALELKGVRLVADLAPALPAAWIDALQTERCLANLLDNAIKFTPEGGTVTVRTAAEPGCVVVTVGDSGPGISAERAAHLFDSFQHGADSDGRRSTGLGLHIADALVRAMGGSLRLERGAPHGAWFAVRLPVAVESGSSARPAALAEHAA